MFVALVGLSLSAACRNRGPVVQESRLEGIVRTNLDSPRPTPVQLARKKKNTAHVLLAGLPTTDALPVVEDDSKVTPRTKEAVAQRCLAAVICAIKGESNDQKLAIKLVQRYGAGAFLSPKERAFIDDPSPSKQALANFAWRYEAVHVFLWALGYLPELNAPSQIADVPKEVAIIRDKGSELAAGATLRPLAEILDQADLYYRLHWAAIELRLAGQKSERANEEIIDERHRALNWLIRYMGQEWDDVKTDT
jgi:hypothetical protein